MLRADQHHRRAASVILWLAPLFICAPSLQSQSASLPPGPFEAKVRTACTECHEARIILQQRLSKKLWTKEVEKMVKWGTLVDPADRDAFIDYLSLNFPPEKPAEPMPRVAAEKKP
jgi:hypothetical protein